MSDWLSNLERKKRIDEERKRKEEDRQKALREEQRRIALSKFLPREQEFAALFDSLQKYVTRACNAGVPVVVHKQTNPKTPIYYLTLHSSNINSTVTIALDGSSCLVTFEFSYIDVHDGSRKKRKIASEERIPISSISERHFEQWVRWAHEHRKEKIKWSRLLPPW